MYSATVFTESMSPYIVYRLLFVRANSHIILGVPDNPRMQTRITIVTDLQRPNAKSVEKTPKTGEVINVISNFISEKKYSLVKFAGKNSKESTKSLPIFGFT